MRRRALAFEMLPGLLISLRFLLSTEVPEGICRMSAVKRL